MRCAQIKRDRKDQGGGPGIYGIEQQWLMAADVIGDQPDHEPDDGHFPYLPSALERLQCLILAAGSSLSMLGS
jgi:hypothetical protein